MGRGSSTSLAPGFRFHPTDEELVRYYLKRKILNKPSFDAISVIDIYRSEPWDLPDKSKLKSRDLEWYFFSALDKKYGNGSRTNRATERGYWKTTGKDRAVRHRERIVGMKKTLVYHQGRAPRGERTNWVMHEYRITDEEMEKAGTQQDAFVLCRVFQKSGSGPKNGEQYGAPFVEEEWEDDEAIVVPGQYAVAVDEEVADDDAFVEVNDIDKKLDIGNPSVNAFPPLNFCHEELSNRVEYSREFSEDYQKPPGNLPENAFFSSNFHYGESSNHAEYSMDFNEDYQKPMVMHAAESDSMPHHEHAFSDLPEPNEIPAHGKLVKDEYDLEPIENINPADNNYLLQEPYLDVNDYPPANDGFFLEANDLSNPIDPESEFFDLEEYLTFDDADDQPLPFDSDPTMGSKIPLCDQEPLPQTDSYGGTEQVSYAQEPTEQHGNGDASTSQQELKTTEFEPDTKYPFIKKASQMLGSFPAPPAFASEFPSKDVALKFNSATQASSSVHVMAGMIRITNMNSSGSVLDWSNSKNGNVNIVLSFTLPLGGVNSSNFVPMTSLLSGKTQSVVARGRFFLMLFLVLIVSLSFKLGTCVYKVTHN